MPAIVTVGRVLFVVLFVFSGASKLFDIASTTQAITDKVILPSELFQGPYFCVAQEERWFAEAHPWREHPCVTALAPLVVDALAGARTATDHRTTPDYRTTTDGGSR